MAAWRVCCGFGELPSDASAWDPQSGQLAGLWAASCAPRREELQEELWEARILHLEDTGHK